MKKYVEVLLIPVVSVLLLPLVFSLFNLLHVEVAPFLYLATTIIMTFITGIFVGKVSSQKAYLKGLAFGLMLVAIMFLFSLFMKAQMTWFTIIYYLILVISSTLGSMIGITKKG